LPCFGQIALLILPLSGDGVIIAEVSRDSVKEFGYNRPVIGAMRKSEGAPLRAWFSEDHTW